MQFGSLNLKSNLFLSPLAGYTNLPFRLTAREIGGLDLATTDLVNARSLIERNRKALELIETNEADTPLAVQLFGAVPEEMRDAAVWLQEQGVDSVDINMGCPSKKIVNSQHGSALMKDVDGACRIIEAIRSACNLEVSVKTRLGWENADNLIPFAKSLEAAGTSLVTIHGRTYRQAFKGDANWEIGRASCRERV